MSASSNSDADAWAALTLIFAVLTAHAVAFCLAARRMLQTEAARDRWTRLCALFASRIAPQPVEPARATAGLAQAPAATSQGGPKRWQGPLRVPAPLSDDASLTDVLAIDCEMVGCGFGGNDSIVASVCVVNAYGNVLYYSLVKPRQSVIDYRTKYSGITKEMLASADARPFSEVRGCVLTLIEGRIVVGHSVDQDFTVLGIDHPTALSRDTAHDLRRLRNRNRPRKLKHLVEEWVGLKIQRQGDAGHDPVEDARASLFLYLHFRAEFEVEVRKRNEAAARRATRTYYDDVEDDGATAN
ncbi:ribonuclease H-like domain-containing protein [Pavlovales sp. CCMP2436]|nr:ribonuclease H-like domain-containing protein [Pavlovales sp. CCMP2436]|mmetsp:Transcript_43416/g.107320  ORF Transcript_43416/g.107320 Transcript_43416/m.107320 type:complete len:299 (+) Transcript_43416:52-948(+)